MTPGAPILIVGASAAGVSAARTLRANAFDGDIVLIDADPHPPYERPPLSKALLENPSATCADFPLLTPIQARDLGVTLRLGTRALRLDAENLALELEDGEIVAGRAILMATGGRARRLDLPGFDLPGVHVIRDFADVLGLRADLATAETIAVIGGGLIGTEAAVAIARVGRRVVWIDSAERPLAHVFPAPIADHLTTAHTAAGVILRAGARLRGLVAGRNGRVAGVELRDGEIIGAQAVVVGVGMSPDDALCREAGLEVADGVHVTPDQRTSAPRVFAAGDVAALPTGVPGGRRRHQHWRAAETQGANAAMAMLGLPMPAPTVDWFWSDQGPHHVEMAGRATGDSVERGGGKGPIVFEMEGPRLVGVASIDEPNAVRAGIRLIQAGRAMDRAALADSGTDLRSLLKAAP